MITDAGHRLYAEDDVRRLYRVLALRRLGLGREEIASVLDDERRAPEDELILDPDDRLAQTPPLSDEGVPEGERERAGGVGDVEAGAGGEG